MFDGDYLALEGPNVQLTMEQMLVQAKLNGYTPVAIWVSQWEPTIQVTMRIRRDDDQHEETESEHGAD